MVKQATYYRDPSQWSTTAAWYPGDVEAALAAADAGTLEQAADICDAMVRDDRIHGVLSTRVGALLGLNNSEKLEFEADSKRVLKAVEQDWWDATPEAELGRLLQWGLFLGVGYGRAIPTNINGRWIPVLETWHPRFLSVDYTTRHWIVQTEQGPVEVDPADPTWTFFEPYGKKRPWAEGAWLACGLLWLIKLHGLRGWGKHNEKHGSGAIVGKAPEGSKESDRRAFWNDLKVMAKSAAIVLPSGYELEMLEAQARTWETFAGVVDTANAGLAIVLLGQPLTTEVPTSANTGATSASKVRQDYLELDAGKVATWAHGYLQPWAQWNFGGTNLAPWPRFETAPPEDLGKEASTLNTLGDGLAKLLAVEPALDVRALLERFGLPLRTDAGPPAPVHEEEPEPEPEPAHMFHVKHGHSAHLSAGVGEEESVSGFVSGQDYVARLADSARVDGAAALRPDVAKLIDIVMHLEDTEGWQEELKAKLVDTYRDMDATAAAAALEKSLILAELAGRVAVLEDV